MTSARKTIPWGPSVWAAMHYIALGYPDHPTATERQTYIRFYRTIPDVLPCTLCRNHFHKILASDPVDDSTKNSTTLFNWTTRVHNRVNETLGKPQFSNVDAISKYLGNNIVDNNSISSKNDHRNIHITWSHKLIIFIVLITCIIIAIMIGLFYSCSSRP